MSTPNPNLILPKDADDLMLEAQDAHPELRNFSHGSDCVKAQNGIGQFVHMTHRALRERIKARTKAPAAAAK